MEISASGALPMDVLYDILLRLPADEVCRLRLVCHSWRSLTSDTLFAKAHATRHPAPHVIVVGSHGDKADEVRTIDLHGKVIRCMQIQQPIASLSIHGDLLCASHGWGQTSVVDMVTGDVVDVAIDDRKKVNSATPYCVLGHVPTTGEYKVLRIQADYCRRRRRQMCEVVTLGGTGDAGRWRRRTPPPATLSIEPRSICRNVAVIAYFLVYWPGREDEGPLQADSIAVFDLATEEWKPATLQGPLTSMLLAGTRSEEDDDWLALPHYRIPNHVRVHLLLREHFKLVRLGESLVVLYCNFGKQWTELWFMEDMADGDTAATRWSRRYTLRCTPFGDDKFSLLQYHYPLAVLDDRKILVWVERMSALRAYDPETTAWTDLATLTGCRVAGLHHGSLLCSNHIILSSRFGLSSTL